MSPHIHRTETVLNFTLGQKRVIRNMIEGDRVASRPQCQSPVNVIVIPLINMLKTVIHCSRQLGKPFNYLVDFLSSSWTRKIPPTESGNGKRESNVLLFLN